jgi:hypothetical protein
MEFEKRRRELEEAAKRADFKEREHKRQLDSLLRTLDDYKEMVKICLDENQSYDFQSERREAESREKFEEFMAEREKIEHEKNELIAEKDRALDEKDKYFQEYRKMTQENEEINRKRYEEHQTFEKLIRKMQSMAMRLMLKNSDDEGVKKLCLDFTNIVDLYEGPQDKPKIEQSIQGLGRALSSAEN